MIVEMIDVRYKHKTISAFKIESEILVEKRHIVDEETITYEGQKYYLNKGIEYDECYSFCGVN